NKDTLIWRKLICDDAEEYRMKSELMTTTNESPVKKLLPAPLLSLIYDLHVVTYSTPPDYKLMQNAINVLQNMDDRPVANRQLEWTGRISVPS
ncbi:hypothetical protein PFISCL1PPCAC_17426, partial [Pristionchus fissidentatus]